MRPDAIRQGAERPADRIRRACGRVAVVGGLLLAGWLLATALSGAQARADVSSQPAPPQSGVAGLLDHTVTEVLDAGREPAPPADRPAPLAAAAGLVQTLVGRDGLLDRSVTVRDLPLPVPAGHPAPASPAAWHAMPHEVLITGDVTAAGVTPAVRVRITEAATPASDRCGRCAPHPSAQTPAYPSPPDGTPGTGDDLAPGQQHFQPAGLATGHTIDPPVFAAPAPVAYSGPAANGSPADPAVSPD